MACTIALAAVVAGLGLGQVAITPPRLLDGLEASRLQLSTGVATVIDTVRVTRAGEEEFTRSTHVFLAFDYSAGKYRFDRQIGENSKKFVVTPQEILDFDNLAGVVSKWPTDHKPVVGLELFDVRAVGFASRVEYVANVRFDQLMGVLRKSKTKQVTDEGGGLYRLVTVIQSWPKVRQTILVDVKRGFVPVKVERERLLLDGVTGRLINRATIEWAETNGCWIPRHAVLGSFNGSREITNELWFTWEAVNEDIPDRLFSLEGLKLPVGTVIGNHHDPGRPFIEGKVLPPAE